MDFNNLKYNLDKWKETPQMPVLFVGHGSPMNAIEANTFSLEWQKLGTELPRPNAVICISAHWLSKGTFITAMDKPKTIHDFYGFPKALGAVQYPAPGSPELAAITVENIHSVQVQKDMGAWGLDHGSWSVLKHIYPAADIPVLELSIDHTKDLNWHYAFAKELAALRRKGVLIVGSGNIVHNLRIMDWSRQNEGYDWAVEANSFIKEMIVNNNVEALSDAGKFNAEMQLAVPTPEHYIPMLYALALKEKKEGLSFFNDQLVMGSISMASFIIGDK